MYRSRMQTLLRERFKIGAGIRELEDNLMKTEVMANQIWWACQRLSMLRVETTALTVHASSIGPKLMDDWMITPMIRTGWE